MKKVNITIIMILLGFVSFSQISIEANYGYGIYSLKDLRDMNSEILKNLPVEGKITDDFPAQPYYSAGVYYQTSDNVSLGITGKFYTTGSRISYKDYSGELEIDNILSSYSPGIAARFKLIDKKLSLFEETRISYGFTKLKMKEKIIGSTDENIFKSFGVQVEPRFKLSYRINGLEFGLNGGYLIDFGGKNRLVGNKDAVLQYTVSNEEIKTNWSGMRIGASVGYYFQFL
jgi:hypothetical protein